MKLFITGADGFVGSWLIQKLLSQENAPYDIVATDIRYHNLKALPKAVKEHKNLRFFETDLLQDFSALEKEIEAADVIIPLAAIANPFHYVKDPLRVFKLDFEVNLQFVKWAVKHKKRLIFPSTSEVYGMCQDESFDEEESQLILGPVQKMRWIYSSSKQLLDRVICAYGIHEGLSYSIFRPFNWMGPRLDDILATEEGASRAITQFMSNAINGRAIKIVGTGEQRRAFIWIEDAIDGLAKIIENPNNNAHNQIFNIGNPHNDHSIRTVAETVIETTKTFSPSKQKANASKIVYENSEQYFGKSYQDVSKRVPNISKAQKLLNWTPKVSFEDAVCKTLSYYLA